MACQHAFLQFFLVLHSNFKHPIKHAYTLKLKVIMNTHTRSPYDSNRSLWLRGDTSQKIKIGTQLHDLTANTQTLEQTKQANESASEFCQWTVWATVTTYSESEPTMRNNRKETDASIRVSAAPKRPFSHGKWEKAICQMETHNLQKGRTRALYTTTKGNTR